MWTIVSRYLLEMVGNLISRMPMYCELGVLNVMGSAIDRDLVSSLHQPLPQLFDTGFKATVAGRYAAGAEKGDLHQKTLS